MDLREIDKLVAEKVMGRTPRTDGKTCYSHDPHCIYDPCLKHYSTDIAAAWKVVEEMGGSFGFMKVQGLENYQAHFGTFSQWMDGASAPLAICLAALKAKGVEVPG